MPLYQFQNVTPSLGQDCFIAPSAEIVGKVHLADNVSIWFQTVVRGDDDEIYIGENTNIQDLCMLHVVRGMPLKIGKNVSVGHKATLHACTIGDGCLIGMDSVVLDGAVIGKNSVVAAGAVVPPNKVFPEGSMIMGAPAGVKRELTADEIEKYSHHYTSYLGIKESYLADGGFKRLN